MRKLWMFAIVLLLAVTPVLAQDAARTAPPDATTVQLVEIESGFTRPLYVTHANDESGRLFVVEQGGLIWILRDGERLESPFLDLSGIVSQEATQSWGYTERGLLGLAFHPDYVNNGLFFVNYTDRDGTTNVARYSVSADNPDAADLNSGVTLLSIPQPFPNHNGGHMAFGLDGFLYIATGDGGSAGDPQGHGQNLSSLLGKILRIDVNSGDPYAIPPGNPFVADDKVAPEIWAYGLRNPWRFSFDRLTGDLYMGDVGQNQWEEVNFQPADSPGGENYGWNILEASQPYSGADVPEDVVMPIAEYAHDIGISVSGGYVYRGEAIPDLQGVYLYGDFGSGYIWYAYRDAAGAWVSDVFTRANGRTIASFGEDAAGELYLVDYNGSIVQFVPAG